MQDKSFFSHTKLQATKLKESPRVYTKHHKTIIMQINPNNLRYQSDRRQIGGLLMILGFCYIIQPQAGLVSGFGPEGSLATDPSTIPFWGLVAGFCLWITGMTAVLTGYLVTVHDWSHEYLTLTLIVFIQTAWIPYITDMTMIGKLSRLPAEENMFIPQAYNPTDGNVKLVGAIG